MNWTKEQRQAIYAPGNLLVSAAAGAGKTAVLTERIARLVAEGTDIRSILVVTFTEAAAGEMKARIEARLYKAAAEADAAGNAVAALRLQRQAQSLPSANISTVHAFCLYVLHRYFYEAGLDPAFTTADDATAKQLFQQALEEAAGTRYETEPMAFRALLRAFGGESGLFDAVRALYLFLQAQPWPFAWLDDALAMYDMDEAALIRHPAIQVLLQEAKQQAVVAQGSLRQAQAMLVDYPAAQSYMEAMQTMLGALQQPRSLHEFRAALDEIVWPQLRWPKAAEETVKEQAVKLRDEAKSILKKLAERMPRSLSQEAAAIRDMRPTAAALCAFLQDTHSQYAAKKHDRSIIDFSDMEHMALEVLQNEQIRTEIRGRFSYVFVDEYQDSSRIQEALINAIRRDDSLFLVGDVKQSIYRFRQADPTLFLDKLACYAEAPEEPECPKDPVQPGMQIHLNANHRSSRAVIDAVNLLFSAIMKKEWAEMDYDAHARLNLPKDSARKVSPLDGCELHILEKPGSKEDQNGLESARNEALLAASRIRELMRTQTYTEPKTGVTRPLRYADFVVLLRSHRGVAEAWASTLAAQGVPAYAQLTGGYFNAIEVQVFLNLLRVIDNRRQDIPLLSVLYSPIGGFTQPMLIELKTECGGGSYIERLATAALRQDALGAAARGFLERLAAWQQAARLIPVTELIAALLDSTGFYDCIGALKGGAQRQANLDALLTHARVCGDGGLSGFLRFMDHARDNADIGPAQSGGADVVRILSMHGSKGLEYPVVIAAGLGKGFNAADKRANLLADGGLGLGLRCVLNDRMRHDTVLRQAVAVKTMMQQRAEEMRILYVCMTRATSHLVMIGSMPEPPALPDTAAAAPVSDGALLQANCFLGWLLPVFRQPGAGIALASHSRQSIQALAQPPAAAAAPAADPALLAAIRQRFTWEYPYAGAERVPSKVSVSRLVHGGKPVIELPVPSFARETAAATNAAALGSATHALLQNVARKDCPAADGLVPYLQQEAARLAGLGLLPQELCGAIDYAGVAAFLKSPLGLRLRQAARAEFELEFAAEMPADTLMGEASSEPVLMQGVIDCCFMEDGAWTLLDYKTDRLRHGETPEQVAARHAAQLALYAEALERLSGTPVAHRYIVLLSARENVEMDA